MGSRMFPTPQQGVGVSSIPRGGGVPPQGSLGPRMPYPGEVPTVGRTGLDPSRGPFRYAETIVGLVEVRTQPIWSAVQLAAAATNFTVFFNFAVGANRWLTNMKQSGQLPGAVAYKLRRIGVAYPAAVVTADKILLEENGVAVLNVASKEVFECPIKFLPGGGGAMAELDGAAAAVVHYTNGIPAYDAMYKLAEPLVIKGGQDFNITIYWGAGITPSAVVYVQVILHGEMLIPVS